MAHDLAVYADANLRAHGNSSAAPTLVSLSAAAAALALTPVTLNPTADTYSEDGSPTTNFGSSGELRVKKTAGTANREAVLKFDLSSLGGAPAASAVLRVYGRLQDSRQSNVITDVYATTTGWTESGVNWNNRPAAVGTKRGSVTVQNTTARYYDVDLSAFVQAELAAGRTTIAFLLKNPTNASPFTTFNSRNAANNKPQLVVTPAGPPVNAAPTANAGADQTITLPATASLTGAITDDGLPSGTVTTSWTKFSGPGTVTFGNTSLLSTTAAFSAPGTYVLRLAANDGELIATDDVTIVVNPAGAATSTLNPTADSYVEDAAPTTNFGTSAEMRVKKSPNFGFNREGVLKFDLAALTGTVTSVTLRLYGRLQDTRQSNVLTQVFATGTTWTETGVTWNTRPAAVGSSLGSITVQNTTAKYYDLDLTAFVQAERAAGRNVIGLLLRNPSDASPYTTFSSRNASANKPLLVVSTVPNAANVAPTVSAGTDQAVALPNLVTLAGSASDDGLPAGTLSIAWSKVSGPGTVTFGNASLPSTTAAFSAAGTYVLRLTASDGSLSSSDDVVVLVNSEGVINAAPVVSAGGDAGVTLPGNALLDGTVTDDGLPAAGTLATTWSRVSGPGTVTFGNAALVDTTATFSQPGTYVLRLTASDGALSTSDDVTITVNSNASAQTPFGGTPVSVPGVIELENFDEGGEGVAYHDTTSTNLTGSYRSSGVDVEPTSDSGGGYNLGNVKAGEWTEYTVNVATAGTYTLLLRAATDTGGGTVHVEFNGVDKTGPMVISNTGGWQSWATVQKTGISLQPGQYVVRLSVDSSAWGGDVANLNWMKLQLPPTASPWPTSWQSAQRSPIARFEASSHVLNGKIYVFGGFINSNFQVTKRVDSYDPATNTWTQKGNMPATLAESHLGVTDDGTYIYFAGGFAGDLNVNATPTQTATGTVWRYNPANDTWLQLPSLTRNGQPIVRGAGGLAWENGKLHYFGGNPADRVTNLGDHIVLDLTAGATQWTNAAPMPNPKDHFSVVVMSGKIYAIGGEHGHDQFHAQQSDMHVYDPATNAWTQLASMPIAKSHQEGGTFVHNGRIVFAGGQTDNFNSTSNVIEYDPVTNQWVTLAPLPVQRQGAVVAAIGNKVILTLGGVSTSAPQSETYIGLLPAAPATAAGTLMAAPLLALGGAASVTSSSQVYGASSSSFPESSVVDTSPVTGAVVGSKTYILSADGTMLAVDLKTDASQVVAKASAKPYGGGEGAAIQAYAKKLFVFGGAGASAGRVQVFDTKTNKWSTAKAMPFASAGGAASSLIGGKVYLAGGVVGSSQSATNLAARFDLAGGKWKVIAPLAVARTLATASTDGQLLYVSSGRAGIGKAGGASDDLVQVYDPKRNKWIATGAAGFPSHPEDE